MASSFVAILLLLSLLLLLFSLLILFLCVFIWIFKSIRDTLAIQEYFRLFNMELTLNYEPTLIGKSG